MRMLWALAVAAPLLGTIPPAAWVPARWNWTDVKSLDLISGTPVNCLLLKSVDAAFAAAARERGIIALAVIAPGGDPADAARNAVRANYQGVVLEGDFPKGTAARVKDVLADSKAVVVQLTSRSKMDLAGADPIVGTYQGVWPGIQVLENGAAKAGPSGSAWIDTNTGFIRSVRAWGHDAVWLGNLPPAHTVIPGERYLQALADAALSGGRWILALDDDFAAPPAPGRSRRRARLETHRAADAILRSPSRVARHAALRQAGHRAGSGRGRTALRRHPRHDRRAAYARAPHPAAEAGSRRAAEFARWPWTSTRRR